MTSSVHVLFFFFFSGARVEDLGVRAGFRV